MANRRPVVNSSSSSHQVSLRNAYLQTKTLILTFALVASLISVHCLSLGHRQQPVDFRAQWKSKAIPELDLYSRSNPLDNNLYSQRAAESNFNNQEFSFDSDSRQQQSAGNYYGSPSVLAPSAVSTGSRQLKPVEYLLHRELNGLIVDDDFRRTQPAAYETAVYGVSGGSEQQNSDYDNEKLLADLLMRVESRDQQTPLQYSSELRDSTDLKGLIYSPSVDQSAAGFSLNDDTSDHQLEAAAHELGSEDQKLSNYDVLVDDNNEAARRGPEYDSSPNQEPVAEPKNLTTLLDKEEEEAALRSSASSSLDDRTGSLVSTSSTEQAPSTTTASYGYLVTGETIRQIHSDITGGSSNKTSSWSSSAGDLLHDAYTKLTSFWPGFLKFAGNKTTTATPQGSSVASSHSPANNQKPLTSFSGLQLAQQGGNKDNNDNSSPEHNDNEHTEQPGVKQATQKQETIRTPKTESDEKKPSEEDHSSSPGASAKVDGAKVVDKSGAGQNKKRLALKTTSSLLSSAATKKSKLEASGEIEGENDNDNGENNDNFSLLRQTSLVMPIKSNDELVIEASSSSGQPDSLIGRYIYAPEHHFHLNAEARGPNGDSDDDRMFGQPSQRSYMRHLHPGDTVYGAYEGFTPSLYSSRRVIGDQQQQQSASMVPKNDVYFLVMVAAFCAMAMAVVLSAGLFAYRVQQSRKVASETDYPTYGVVGPNNMNGKGGAASFVGGYFGQGGSGGPGSALASNLHCANSKAGSVKQLADLYGVADSNHSSSAGKSKSKRATGEQAASNMNLAAGNATGGSAASNKNSFMANQNAARMYHYQHQKQQMIISDRASAGRHTSASDLDSEDENDDGTYTVYECPGLASAHDMEIKNPLFNDDHSP